MSGNAPRSRKRLVSRRTSWDRVATWYDGWVGDRGSVYHRAIAIPGVMDLLAPEPGEEILDVGAGQGVLAPYITERRARYTGIDASPRLIAHARKRHGQSGRFLVGDARRLHDLLRPELNYDAAVFLLSLQDMDPIDGIIASVGGVLRPGGRIVILLTHPAFRQPRHSGWGHDPTRKLTFRRIDAYLTPMAVPMKAIAGRPPTLAFHRPISAYVNALVAAGFVVDRMLELADIAPGQTPSRAQPRAGNLDIPLFLGLRGVRKPRS